MKDKQMHKNATYFLVLSFFILTATNFFSCRSTPTEEELPEINPLSLLDDQSSVYVSIPVQKHITFVADILVAQMNSLSQDDAKKIAGQITMMYGGISTVKDRKRIQLAAEGSFPNIAIKTVFKEKNGWTKFDYEAPSTEQCLALNYPNSFSYYTRTDTDLQLSFPSTNIICVSRNVPPLLDQYALRPDCVMNPQNKWISQQTDDVLFYITKPGQYLRGLIGQPIEIGCDSVQGKIVYIPSKKDATIYTGIYELSFDVTVINTKAQKVLYKLLTLSLGMTDAVITIKDEKTISVTQMTISEKEILNLFTR